MRTSVTPLKLLALILAIGSALELAVGAQVAAAYRDRLAPVPIDVSMQAAIAGSGLITATLSGRALAINGTFQGIRSPATIANVHRGMRGVRGAVVDGLTLTVSGTTSGAITGTLTLTPAQVSDLGKGWLYVQLYSEKAPDGNLWGWLLPEVTK